MTVIGATFCSTESACSRATTPNRGLNRRNLMAAALVAETRRGTPVRFRTESVTGGALVASGVHRARDGLGRAVSPASSRIAHGWGQAVAARFLGSSKSDRIEESFEVVGGRAPGVYIARPFSRAHCPRNEGGLGPAYCKTREAIRSGSCSSPTSVPAEGYPYNVGPCEACLDQSSTSWPSPPASSRLRLRSKHFLSQC